MNETCLRKFISTMFQSLKAVLCEQLAASPRPVERDIAGLLETAPASDEAAVFRLGRYHRKIDVARRVMSAYDDRIEKATSAETISGDGYLALALVFIAAAQREPGVEEASRANLLRWVNSAFNCLDQANCLDHAEALDQIDAELHALLKKGSMA